MNLLFALLLSGAVNVVAREARPISDPATWITSDDYPPAAMLGDMQGATGVQMAISADGAVTGCTVILSSGHPILDDLTCSLLRLRARFEPARDRQGRAIASQLEKRIRWQMPKDAAGNTVRMPPPQPFSITVDFDIDEQGNVENCTTSSRSGIFTAPDFCGTISSYPMEPYRDAKGVPVRKHGTYRSSITIEDAPAASSPTSPKAPSR